MPAPRIHVDPTTFEPWKIQALTHSLSDHPLLQIDALVELGKRQEARKLVRTHSSDATAGNSDSTVSRKHCPKLIAIRRSFEVRPLTLY